MSTLDMARMVIESDVEIDPISCAAHVVLVEMDRLQAEVARLTAKLTEVEAKREALLHGRP